MNENNNPDPVPRRRMLEVFGWASDNYSDSGPPAVIVNPDASAMTLLSWGIGQLEQCNAVLDAITSEQCGCTDAGGESANAIRHFTVQAEAVLRAGIERLGQTGART